MLGEIIVLLPIMALSLWIIKLFQLIPNIEPTIIFLRSNLKSIPVYLFTNDRHSPASFDLNQFNYSSLRCWAVSTSLSTSEKDMLIKGHLNVYPKAAMERHLSFRCGLEHLSLLLSLYRTTVWAVPEEPSCCGRTCLSGSYR